MFMGNIRKRQSTSSNNTRAAREKVQCSVTYLLLCEDDAAATPKWTLFNFQLWNACLRGGGGWRQADGL